MAARQATSPSRGLNGSTCPHCRRRRSQDSVVRSAYRSRHPWQRLDWDTVYLPGARSDLVFLVLEDQQAQSLESKVLAEVRMPDSILFVCFYYLLPIILLISRSRLNNEFHFVLRLPCIAVPVCAGDPIRSRRVPPCFVLTCFVRRRRVPFHRERCRRSFGC